MNHGDGAGELGVEILHSQVETQPEVLGVVGVDVVESELDLGVTAVDSVAEPLGDDYHGQ